MLKYKSNPDSKNFFLIEDSLVYNLNVSYAARFVNRDTHEFAMELLDSNSRSEWVKLHITGTLSETRLDSLVQGLPPKEMENDYSHLYAAKALAFFRKENVPKEHYVLGTENFAKLFVENGNQDGVDEILLDLMHVFFKTFPDEVLTVEDLFISTGFKIDQIVQRIPYFKARKTIKTFFSNALNADEMYTLFNSERGKRIGTLGIWKEESGYLLADNGIKHLEELMEGVQPRRIRYAQIVKIPQINRKFAFVLLPLKEGNPFLPVYDEVIKPTIENELKLQCLHAEEVTEPGVINNQVYTCIERAEIIIAELSEYNRNVDIELGMALRANKAVYILTNHEIATIGFDLQDKRIIKYKDEKELREKLIEKIKLNK